MIVVLALALPPGLRAQVLRGRLIPAQGDPAGGAVVILLDSAGVERGRTVSGPSGNYGFVAPAAGRYRIRVLRVGYGPWMSDPVTIGADDVREFSPALPAVRVVLAAIEVTSDTRCSATTGTSDLAATLLDEGRKAVLSADVALHGSTYRYLIRRYQIRTDRNDAVVAADTSAPEKSDVWPVESAPVEELERNGFVTMVNGAPDTYYGPDAQALFSDFFLRGHCFGVGRMDRTDSTLVPLQFRTAKDRKHPDIEGALWIDRKTLGLQRLDFRYVGLPDWTYGSDAGGRLEFLRLPSGLWIIRRWELRAPVAAKVQGSIWYRYGGLVTVGGEITEIRSAAGDVIFSAGSNPVGAFRR
jgi:hypothetical protein